MTTNRRPEAPALAEAFERLVRRHRSEIFRTVFRLSRNREDAEDLTQITFLNAYAALQRGAEPEAPRAWLHAIARNAGSRRFRQQRIVEVELDDETAASFEEELTVGELQAALARLTLNQRAALLMREVGGLSAREIASRLEISPGAVATLLFRARRALRAELEGTPEGRPLLGGLATLATGLRTAWLRLLGPAWESSPVLSRSSAALGLAAAATGVALITTSAVPVPARADHVRALRVVASAHASGHVAHVRQTPVVQVALPVAVRGAVQVHVALHVSRQQSRPHHVRAVAPAPRTRVSSTPAASASAESMPVETAPADPSVTKNEPAPSAKATETATPAASQPSAPVEAPEAGRQPVSQAKEVVTSAAQSVPSSSAVTSAATSAAGSAASAATSAVTSATTSPALPATPPPPPVEVPAVPTPPPPPVESPALPPPPGGILPIG